MPVTSSYEKKNYWWRKSWSEDIPPDIRITTIMGVNLFHQSVLTHADMISLKKIKKSLKRRNAVQQERKKYKSPEDEFDKATDKPKRLIHIEKKSFGLIKAWLIPYSERRGIIEVTLKKYRIGSCYYSKVSDTSIIYMDSFAIEYTMRGKGIGKMMMVAFCKAMIQLGHTHVEWNSHPKNTPANKIYEKVATKIDNGYRRNLLWKADLNAFQVDKQASLPARPSQEGHAHLR